MLNLIAYNLGLNVEENGGIVGQQSIATQINCYMNLNTYHIGRTHL